MANHNTDAHDSATRLSLYLYYAGQTETLIERRNASSRYFLTINTGLVAILSLALKLQPGGSAVWLMTLALAGGSCACCGQSCSYRVLTKARFDVIQVLEQQLPAAPYTDEWQRIKQSPAYKGYRSLARLEAIVPWIFMAIYAALVAGSLLVPPGGHS